MEFTPESADIFTSFPKAQDSYMAAWEAVKQFDNSSILEYLSKRIKEASEKGRFIVAVGGLQVAEAEKTGIQLEKLGYSTSATPDTGVMGSDGNTQPRCVLSVSWLHMPANKRDEYTV